MSAEYSPTNPSTHFSDTTNRFANRRLPLYSDFMRTRILLLLALFSACSFAAKAPRKSPEFAITTPDGKQLLLSSYRGKVVCFLFILTT